MSTASAPAACCPRDKMISARGNWGLTPVVRAWATRTVYPRTPGSMTQQSRAGQARAVAKASPPAQACAAPAHGQGPQTEAPQDSEALDRARPRQGRDPAE